MAAATTEGGTDEQSRQMWWYFGGLAVFYLVGVVAFWPASGEEPNQTVFLVVMAAPTVGALVARWRAGARIQWGRPGVWLVVSLVPMLAVLAVYIVGASAGWDVEDPDVLVRALTLAPIGIVTASVSALGEEIGWRGFLWPTLRQERSFWAAAARVGVVWWLYHVPLILLGWYGSLSGLPAFTLAVAGFTLFAGVLTDRSRSLWPSVVAHGSWNAMVATSFSATEATGAVPAFSGSDALLGEFGWLAGVTMLAVGLAAAAWHVRRPLPAAAQPAPQ